MKKILAVTLTGVLMISVFAMRPGMTKKDDVNGKRPNMADSSEMFSNMDINDDGVVSKDEFEKAHQKMKKMQGKMGERPEAGFEMMRQIRERFDKDGDGKLSEEEKDDMKDFMKKRFEERKQEMLNRFDADKDGRLSRDEMEKSREVIKTEMDKNKEYIMSKYDKDKDGRLSVDERDNISFEDIQKAPFPVMGMYNAKKNINNKNKMKEKMGNRSDKRNDKSFKNDRKSDKKNSRTNNRNRIGRDNDVIEKYHILRFDADGNGVLDYKERENAREEDKKYQQRFDKDKDGRLNSEEKAEFESFLEKVAEQYISTRERL